MISGYNGGMVFILGGGGFIGTAIARCCARHNLPYTVIKRGDGSRYYNAPCELLINANGSSSKLLAERDPLADFSANVTSVKKSLVNYKFEKYIYISSGDVYPDTTSPLTTVEDQTLPVERQSTYGFHKSLAETCVRHSASQWLILRPGGFVGSGLKKNAIFDIVNGAPLWLDPASRLQYMNVDDFARVLFELVNLNRWNEIFNVCAAGTIKLQDVIEAAGQPVHAQPDSPLVNYELSLQKLSQVTTLPETRDSVLAYIADVLTGEQV